MSYNKFIEDIEKFMMVHVLTPNALYTLSLALKSLKLLKEAEEKDKDITINLNGLRKIPLSKIPSSIVPSPIIPTPIILTSIKNEIIEKPVLRRSARIAYRNSLKS